MGRSRHTEAQIIAALKQVEAGRTVDHAARNGGVSQATVYTWKSKFGGMDVSEAQRLRALEDENSRLKRLVADLSLDKEMLKAVIAKKGLGSWTEGRMPAGCDLSTRPASAGCAD